MAANFTCDDGDAGTGACLLIGTVSSAVSVHFSVLLFVLSVLTIVF